MALPPRRQHHRRRHHRHLHRRCCAAAPILYPSRALPAPRWNGIAVPRHCLPMPLSAATHLAARRCHPRHPATAIAFDASAVQLSLLALLALRCSHSHAHTAARAAFAAARAALAALVAERIGGSAAPHVHRGLATATLVTALVTATLAAVSHTSTSHTATIATAFNAATNGTTPAPPPSRRCHHMLGRCNAHMQHSPHTAVAARAAPAGGG